MSGTAEDDLAAVIEYLSAFYNIDYTWFPQRRSQPAYMAHCPSGPALAAEGLLAPGRGRVEMK